MSEKIESKNISIPKYGKHDIQKCHSKFKFYIIDKLNNLPFLREKLTTLAINSNLQEELIRPFAWKLFLKTLSFNGNVTLRNWIEETFQNREIFKKKLAKIKSEILLEQQSKGQKGEKDLNKFSNFEENSSIRHLIEIDVERTYGDIKLFQDEYIRNMEQEILYVFAQENKPTSYKQGMNEILAIFIYSFYPFYISSPIKDYTPNKFDLWCKNPGKYINEIYAFFHDENEFQSDLYYILYNIMNMGLNKFYEDGIDPDSKKDDQKTYLLLRCDYILEKLKIHNLKLYNHFIDIGMSAEVILQRWLKCVFSREFTPEDCILIWDNILANEFNVSSKNLEYIDYFCVAMFDYISNSLMDLDQNECFITLFKYPPFQSINILVEWSEKVKENILRNDKPSIFSNIKNRFTNFKFDNFTNLFNNNDENEEQRRANITAEINKITNNKNRVISLKNILNKYKNKFDADDKIKIEILLNSLEKDV